jgi:hypothetical protein
MSDFLSSVKADLLDRRLLPILALVGLALAGALAYAVLGGVGSSAPAPAASSAAPTPAGTSGIAVTQAQASADKAVAETTNASSRQREGGSAHNPFAPLPGASSTTSTAASSSKTSSSSSASGSGSSKSSQSGSSSPSSSGGTSPASTPRSPSPAKPQTVYHVAVLFGVAAAGTPPQSAHLIPYENLKRQQPLPSSSQPLVVFRGVTAGGKSAMFTLVGEAILHGNAACLPSASQCEAIDLKFGQTEELEYLPASGPAITYELQVVSIASSKASTAAAKRAFASESKAGLRLLRRLGLAALPDHLRYSTAKGVLVFAGHPAFTARAHTAVRPRRHGH